MIRGIDVKGGPVEGSYPHLDSFRMRGLEVVFLDLDHVAIQPVRGGEHQRTVPVYRRIGVERGVSFLRLAAYVIRWKGAVDVGEVDRAAGSRRPLRLIAGGAG